MAQIHGKWFTEKREEYKEDINIYYLASEMVIECIIPASSLREELVKRFEAYSSNYLIFSERKHPVYPV